MALNLKQTTRFASMLLRKDVLRTPARTLANQETKKRLSKGPTEPEHRRMNAGDKADIACSIFSLCTLGGVIALGVKERNS